MAAHYRLTPVLALGRRGRGRKKKGKGVRKEEWRSVCGGGGAGGRKFRDRRKSFQSYNSGWDRYYFLPLLLLVSGFKRKYGGTTCYNYLSTPSVVFEMKSARETAAAGREPSKYLYRKSVRGILASLCGVNLALQPPAGVFVTLVPAAADLKRIKVKRAG